MKTENQYWTIDGFEQLTPEDIIRISTEHVRKNGRPSFIPGTRTCSYEGIGCGAAPFLRPEKRGAAETKTWHVLYEKGHVPDAHLGLVQALQSAHDQASVSQVIDGLPFLAVYEKALTSSTLLRKE